MNKKKAERVSSRSRFQAVAVVQKNLNLLSAPRELFSPTQSHWNVHSCSSSLNFEAFTLPPLPSPLLFFFPCPLKPKLYTQYLTYCVTRTNSPAQTGDTTQSCCQRWRLIESLSFSLSLAFFLWFSPSVIHAAASSSLFLLLPGLQAWLASWALEFMCPALSICFHFLRSEAEILHNEA